MQFKILFYDWLGLNQIIHSMLSNFTTHPIYYQAMKFASNFLANYALFPVHLLLFIAIASLILHKKNVQSHSSLTKLHSGILRSGYILFILLAVEFLLIEAAKRYFAMPRPYCLNYITPENTDCLRSFPSGHTAYIMTWVLSLWLVLNKKLKFIAVILVVWTALSRISLSMHYPADILGAIISTVICYYFIAKYVSVISSYFSDLNYKIMKLLVKV